MSPRAHPLATTSVLAPVPPTTPHPTTPTVCPTATPPWTDAGITSHLTVATALPLPLIDVPTSTPLRMAHALATATPAATTTLPQSLATALHRRIALVTPTTRTPTPPAVWPPPPPPEAALLAASTPHTIVGVATAPPRGVGCIVTA